MFDQPRQPIPTVHTLLLTVLLFLSPSVLASPSSLSAGEGSSSSSNNINATITLEKRQMSQGSSCEGSEGQWNCLTNQWQRCASGQWSPVTDCAAGTICTPSGLTYDFFVQFANGAAGSNPPATSGGAPRPSSEAKSWIPRVVVLLGGGAMVAALVVC